MCYKTFDVSKLDERDIFTFISFNIATARSQGFGLLKFEFDSEASEKLQRLFLTKLKYLKKQGSIDCFASVADFANGDTEAIYIINKYPTLSEEDFSANDVMFFFVKL